MTLLKVVVRFPCGRFHRSSFPFALSILPVAICFIALSQEPRTISINKSIKIHVHSDCLPYFHSLTFWMLCSLHNTFWLAVIITVKRQPNLFSVNANAEKKKQPKNDPAIELVNRRVK